MQTVEAPRQTNNLADKLQKDFPILQQQVNGKKLIYLDNAATSQKPVQVRQAMEDYYGPAGYNSNVHRGVHFMSSKATAAYEQARDKIARFINARTSREIVFVKNASEGINLIANTWGTANIKQGDEVCSFSTYLTSFELVTIQSMFHPQAMLSFTHDDLPRTNVRTSLPRNKHVTPCCSFPPVHAD